MRIIDQAYKVQIECKKSIFIAHLYPFADFKNSLEALKKEHKKAGHFVWALRYLNDFKQIIEDKSDDGEPKNTAGAPCLNVLRGAGLINIAVVVVRYFGGIKLGTGGLVRAYSESINAAIRLARLSEFELKESLNLSLPLSLFSRMKHYLTQNKLNFNATLIENEFLLEILVNEEERLNLIKFCKKLGLRL
ncbi:IMPACT family protein [Campylobacter troglodytis]|uniref:IMPACT family protein n=1 Tax=Campylobacter troglodytis TaxID=654363 RepID=UPI00115B28DC|nr:YigZ family protein [Campylobacter troglodytis]TQR53847.1 phosphoenolpyruvate carboxykinase [Campylobacter troglodytis]